MVAEAPGGTTIVDQASSMIVGPAMLCPDAILERS
jgi:hypothetical protein